MVDFKIYKYKLFIFKVYLNVRFVFSIFADIC